MTLRPAPLRAALVGLPLVLALAGCAGKPADSAAATSTSASAASSASGTPSAGTQQRIEVTFANGKAGGDTGRVQVAEGTSVTLVVTSDVADEVHVHGYDKKADVKAGGTATITFTADIPGQFEVELESAHLKLVELRVS